MVQKLSLFQLLSKRACSWVALALLGVSTFLLIGPLGRLAPPFSLKTWEFFLALILSLQTILSPFVRQLIQSHLPTRIHQRWVIPLLEGCLSGLFFLLVALLFSPIWDHILLIFDGPLLIALLVATLIMMGFYISGRFS